MTVPYVVLTDSAAAVTKRLRAIKMSMPIQSTDDFKITAGGQVEIAAGVLVDYFIYTFKVPAETADSNYGILDDLVYFFRLRNPNASPSSLLTLTDHYSNSHYVKFKDDIAPEPLTTQLIGPNAWHYVNVTFVKVGEVGS